MMVRVNELGSTFGVSVGAEAEKANVLKQR
jgi:hypothetical protein